MRGGRPRLAVINPRGALAVGRGTTTTPPAGFRSTPSLPAYMRRLAGHLGFCRPCCVRPPNVTDRGIRARVNGSRGGCARAPLARKSLGLSGLHQPPASPTDHRSLLGMPTDCPSPPDPLVRFLAPSPSPHPNAPRLDLPLPLVLLACEGRKKKK